MPNLEQSSFSKREKESWKMVDLGLTLRETAKLKVSSVLELYPLDSLEISFVFRTTGILSTVVSTKRETVYRD